MTYTIWLASPTGERLAILDPFIRLEYRRAVNSTAFARGLFGRVSYPFTLVLPYSRQLLPLLQRDYRLEVWRDSSSGLQHLDTETVWFIQRVARMVTKDGAHVIEVQAVSAIALLERRIIAAAAGSSGADKTGYADDLIKALVRENIGNSASGDGRDVSDWLTIEPDHSMGAQVSKRSAWRNLMTVVQEIADSSTEAGVPLFFDLVASPPHSLAFRTYAHVRGTDRSIANTRGIAPVVLSYETGTLTNITRETEWQDEATHVYVLGQGARDGRQVVVVGDTPRATGVPFGRREIATDARHVTTEAALLAEGQTALREHQPQETLTATLISRAPDAVYGHHWQFGDMVCAEVDGELFACRIDEVEVSIAAGEQSVMARLTATRSQQTRPSPTMSVVPLTLGQETERTYQQVQEQTVPAGEYLYVPENTVLTVYGGYAVAGELQVMGELRGYA